MRSASTSGGNFFHGGSDAPDQLYAVSVLGASERVRVLRYDSGKQKWEER